MKRYLKIGELAKLAEITVRTLHYYDEVGLLKPVQVTESGHRLYDLESFSELYRIMAMKDMGFSLDEIKSFIDSKDNDLLQLIQIQLFRVQEEIAKKQLLLGKLLKLENSVKENNKLSAEDFKEMVPFINTSADEYFSREQFNKLKINNERFNNKSTIVTEWMNFISDLRECYKKNLPQTHPLTMKCVSYWNKITSQFIGNDEQMGKAITSFHSSQESKQLKYGLTDELYRYLMDQFVHNNS